MLIYGNTERRMQMKKKVQIALLTMLLTLLFGSVAVHAEGSFFINMKTATINIGDEETKGNAQVKAME